MALTFDLRETARAEPSPCYKGRLFPLPHFLLPALPSRSAALFRISCPYQPHRLSLCQVKVREAEIFLTFAQCQERVTKRWRPLPCKPDSVPEQRPGDDHSSRRTISRAPLAANPDLWAKAACGDIGYPIKPAQGPYSALLPVGLAMQRLLPTPRWALTPPFHPDRRFCKARPCTTAVCFLWRFPSGYPARALPGTVASGSPDFPRAFAGPRPSSPPRRLGPTPAPALRQSPFEI